MNGTVFVLYLDENKLLLSKSHSLSFSADMVDASYKQPDTAYRIDEWFIWNEVDVNWEDFNYNWEHRTEIPYGGHFKEVIAGMRSGSFSVEGLVEMGEEAVGLWNTTDVNWESANWNWEDYQPSGTSGSVSATLKYYVINRTSLKFKLIADPGSTTNFSYWEGTCIINGYEVVANSEDVFYYNCDFVISGELFPSDEAKWNRADILWNTADFNWEESYWI